MKVLSRTEAETYAAWFKALADPTRVQVLNLVAASGGELTVGEIVERLPVAQSTISHHLRILSEVRFLLVRAAGNANFYRLNARCMDEFPNAARTIIGQSKPAAIRRSDGRRKRP